MKGISPLIAAVLLVAFTMAIAGILAAWATTFSQQRLQTAAQCPAVTIMDVSFLPGDDDEQYGNLSTITMRLLNQNPNIEQTGLKASIVYGTAPNIENQDLGSTLTPLERDTFTLNPDFTGTTAPGRSNTTVPVKVEVVSTECPTTPVAAIIQ